MNKELRLLIDLQKLDSLILTARAALDTLPARISSQEAPLKSAEDACARAQQNQASLEKKKKDAERAIDDINEKLRKLRQRGSEIKTNKEYQAHLKEIELVEKELKSAEDELLLFMEQIEESAKVAEMTKALLAEEGQKLEGIKAEFGREMRTGEEEIRNLMEERKKVMDLVDPDTYRYYMGLLKIGRGLAVVEARNEVCQGCNLHIPPQLFVEIKANTTIIQCPQCRRILYFLKPETGSEQAALNGEP